MANVLYPKYKEFLLTHLTTDTVKAVFVDLTQYTYSTAHQFLSDVPSAARTSTPQTLASKTIANGVFDAADLAATALSGGPSGAQILFVDTGTESTSKLIGYIDTGSGLPLADGSVPTTWSDGANKIFALQ